jgi:hypothetical protein
MNKTQIPSTNKNRRPKMKKDANDPVDIHVEKQMDPKYKTEMCKSWIQTNFCVYGNKCRFAHGAHELFSKSSNTNNYKQKDCKSFVENGFCMYGMRCNFRHGEIKLKEINRSYYSYVLNCYSEDKLKEYLEEEKCKNGRISDRRQFNMGSSHIFNKNKFTIMNDEHGTACKTHATNSLLNHHQLQNDKIQNKKRLSVFQQFTTKLYSSLSENSTENNSENECDNDTEPFSYTNSNSKSNYYNDKLTNVNTNFDDLLNSSNSSSDINERNSLCVKRNTFMYPYSSIEWSRNSKNYGNNEFNKILNI